MTSFGLECMMTSSNGNIFRVTGPLCGEFTGHRGIPRTKASDAELWCFLDLRLNKRLNKQSWGRWSETPSRPLWRHCNGTFARSVIYPIVRWRWKNTLRCFLFIFNDNLLMISHVSILKSSIIICSIIVTQFWGMYSLSTINLRRRSNCQRKLRWSWCWGISIRVIAFQLSSVTLNLFRFHATAVNDLDIWTPCHNTSRYMKNTT